MSSATSNSNGIASLELPEYYNVNNTKTYLSNYTIYANRTSYFENNVSHNVTGNAVVRISLIRNLEPTWDGFRNNLTTNFSLESDFNNVSGATVGIPNFGLINFSENIDVASNDIDANIVIKYNMIYLNSSALSGMNKSAELTLFNLSYSYTPTILRDSELCPASICTGLSYSNGNFIFDVTSFSNYSTIANSDVTLSHTNNINNKLIANQTIWFYANYSNITSGVMINNTNCSIHFSDGVSANMTFNNTLSLYKFNRSFLSASEFDYNVTCNSSVYGFETATAVNSVTTLKNVTLLTLDTSQSLEGLGLYEPKSLIVADYNNDGFDDLVIAGDNATGPTYRVSLMYQNNNGRYVKTDENITGVRMSSIAFIDYDNDGDLDLFVSGNTVDTYGITKMYKNS